ncbi:MAG TPA: alpha/beta hydrolase-fold protein [Acidimicrobiales bacterium]|nr:alpha/beta hydrolase-fold protein [Acidimicrobiales bacterium]
MRPWTAELRGKVDERELTSAALQDNPLGDPATRPIWVYLPESYEGTSEQYPVIYLLQGFGNFLTRWAHRSMFGLTGTEVIAAAFSDGTPECLVVYVDAWTALGGSQFVDSPATGRYHTYLCEDVVSFIDSNYRTLAAREHRAVAGHSSGGYGALVSAMLRPDVFGALAAHAPDCGFWITVRGDLALAHRALRDHYQSSYQRFWEDFRARTPMSRPDDFNLVLIWALSACFSGEQDGSVTLPFEEVTGELIPEVWLRWLAWDPVEMVARYEHALRSCRGIWIDAGRRDEHFADVASEILAETIRNAGAGVTFDLYEGAHRDVAERYPLSIRFLAERITSPERSNSADG